MPVVYDRFVSTQKGPAPRLAQIVQHHACTAYRKPISAHQFQAFEILKNFIGRASKPLIIDSGCGTGLSTYNLAREFPDSLVIGIDKSFKRLSRLSGTLPDNALVLRADLIDMWRLLAQERLDISHHFMFFPNPWPKTTQLKRRFHAHPVFATMVGLAPYFELRTNWSIYAEECALALKILGRNSTLSLKSDMSYMTLFEKKYLESHCPIFIIKSQA